MDSSDKISDATPTSVETIGVLFVAHSNIACGPPSILDATM